MNITFTKLGFLTFLILMQFGKSSALNGQELSIFQEFFGDQYYEDDQKISKKEFIDKIYSVPESAMNWDKYKKNSLWSTVTALATGGAIVWWVSKDPGESTVAPAITTLAGLTIGAIFTQKSMVNRRKAILSYNQNASSSYYRITPSNHGLGLTMHF